LREVSSILRGQYYRFVVVASDILCNRKGSLSTKSNRYFSIGKMNALFSLPVAFSATENDRFQQYVMGIPAILEGWLLLTFASYLNLQIG
jgi:hypothetical protein